MSDAQLKQERIVDVPRDSFDSGRVAYRAEYRDHDGRWVHLGTYLRYRDALDGDDIAERYR